MRFMITLFLLTSTLLFAQELPKDRHLVEGTLKNRFSYTLLKNDKPKDIVEFRLLVKAGSLEEEEDQRGLAHFIEHMAFNGTTHFKKNELISFLESIGLKFGGDLNANTDYERTLYKLTVPVKSDNVDKALTVLYDWAGGLLFSPEEFEKERGVILEEKRLRNSVGFRLYEQYSPLFFSGTQYNKRMVIGDENVLRKGKVERAVDFYKKWYRPELMHLVVVGDIDTAKMQEKIKKIFSSLKNRDHTQPVSREIPENNTTRMIYLTDKELYQNSVELYFLENSEGIRTEEAKKNEYITWMAKELFNTEAQKEVLKEDTKAQQIYMAIRELGSMKKGYLFSAIYSEENRDAAFAQLNRMMWRYGKFGFSKESFARIKKKLLMLNENSYKQIHTQESAKLASEIEKNLEEGTLFVDREADYTISKKLIEEITAEEVNARFKNILEKRDKVLIFKGTEKRSFDKNAAIQIMMKAKEEAKAPLEESSADLKFMQKIPEEKKIMKKSYNKETGITTYVLENNITVQFKPTKNKKNEVLVAAVSKGGLSALPTAMLNDAQKADEWVMRSAPGVLKPSELRALLSDKKIRMNFTATRFEESIQASASPKDLETLFQYLYMQVTAPKIDPRIDVQMRNIYMTLQEKADRDPAYKFDKAEKRFYYKNNPRILFDSKESLKALNTQKMLEIFKQRFSDMNTFHFAIVGDVQEKELETLIKRYFANLPVSQKEERSPEAFDYVKGEQEFLKHFNTTNIADISMKYRSQMPYTLHNTSVVTVMKDILKVRLRNLIREEKSGTYGVGVDCRLTPEIKSKAECEIRFSSDPERSDELIANIVESVEQFKKEGPSEQELKNVKTEYAVFYKRAKENNNFWAAVILESAKSGIEIEKYLSLAKDIESVTAKEVEDAAKTLLGKDRFISKRVPVAEEKKK